MNPELILLLATLATGILWLIEIFYARKQRIGDQPKPFWVSWGANLFPFLLLILPLYRFAGGLFKNFALILLLVTLGTGILWLIDVLYARKHRAAGDAKPAWVEWGGDLFPVILAVFVLRSFVVEPFKIPSGSMIPTLQVGDYILVNKYTYGLRLPVANSKITDGTPLARGDVVVFRFPPDPSTDFIKRVIGLPGDIVSYQNKQLRINGEPVPKVAQPDYQQPAQMVDAEVEDNGEKRKVQSARDFQRFQETLGNARYNTLNDSNIPAFVPDNVRSFAGQESCRYDHNGFVCTVPAGHYFMMGDNRDNSLDSRYWGFVPDANIVGKAFFIWFHWGELGRIGSFQ